MSRVPWVIWQVPALVLTAGMAWAADEQGTSKEAKAHFDKGNEYVGKGEFDQAIAAYTEAIKLAPMHVDTYCNRSVAYREKKEWIRAMADAEKALELDPKSAPAYLVRALVHKARGDLNEALLDLGTTLKYDPKNLVALTHRAQISIARGRLREAVTDLTRAVKLDQKSVVTYLARGLVYLQLGEKGDKASVKLAIKDFDRVIELDPKCPVAFLNRGLAYIHSKKPLEANTDLDRVLELDKDLTEVYVLRALLFMQEKEHHKAVTDLTKAIERYPEAAALYNMRGVAHAYDKAMQGATEQADYQAALDDFGQAIKKKSKYVEAYLNRCTLYSLLGKRKEAEEDFKKAQSMMLADSGKGNLPRIKPRVDEFPDSGRVMAGRARDLSAGAKASAFDAVRLANNQWSSRTAGTLAAMGVRLP